MDVMTMSQNTMKSESNRLRRKLHKITNPLRNCQTTNYTTAKSAATSRSTYLISEPIKLATDKTVPQSRPNRPIPPDLSSPKWLEYVRQSAHLSHGLDHPYSQHQESISQHPLPVIPEFAHLKINDVSPRTSSDTSSSSDDLPFVSSPYSKRSSRRYAKTPVFCIGQLEQSRSREARTAKKVSSVELIAESYRALLESRSSIFTDRSSQLTPSFLYDEEAASDVKGHLRPADIPSHPSTPSMRSSPNQNMGSPASDAGTLVGFEEDAIYFKPIEFNTAPPSPPLHSTQSTPSPGLPSDHQPGKGVFSPSTPNLDNPSFQICLDLLTRELSSAVSGNQLRPSDETSALQIWVMIEAYEKLRDQVMSPGNEEETKPLVDMFNVWLKSLYKIHEKMIGNDGPGNESDYGD